jgi:hypothetical protein
MRNICTWVPPVVAACCVACAASRAPVRLQPEQPTTLRVGQVAALQLREQEDVAGSAGTSVVLIKRSGEQGNQTYLYRAVSVGDQTLLVVPTDLRDGDCVSCVTAHYFIRVVR